MELISKKHLYDRVVELEQKALSDLKEKTATDNLENWVGLNVALMERTAFKHDVMDAPVVLDMPDTGIGDLSDGSHTFNGLYEQRAILFAALVKAYKDKSWKSHRHEDGKLCFGGGWFIVGIDTPKGSYTYHYEDKYWDMFDCVELENGKHWDGHTDADAETRLMSLCSEPHWIPVTERLPEKENERYWVCTNTGYQCQCRWTNNIYGLGSIGDRWGWKIIDIPQYTYVTAWMTLPEPYKVATK